jgi:hypothetical protein
MVVDQRITIPAADADAAEENMDDDPFMRQLTNYLTAPIGDPGSASAVAPLVARVDVPDEKSVADLIKLVQVHDPNQTADWQQKIEKTLTRIAVGLDMPPEEFLGLAQANHWTGWVITDQKWQAHGEPVATRLVNDLTSAYYRPACLEAGVANAERLIVWFDPANVVTHPDRGKDAAQVHDRGALSDAALRRAHNFNDHDAPSEDEREFYEAVKLKARIRPEDESEEDSSDTGSDAPGSEPAQEDERTGEPSPMNDGQETRLLGAAELALERARELAGSRLLSKKMTCDGCFKGAEDVPPPQLAHHLGREVVEMLGFTSDFALVSGGCRTLVATAARWGLPEERAKILAALIERFAAETLFEKDPRLPPDLLLGLSEGGEK